MLRRDCTPVHQASFQGTRHPTSHLIRADNDLDHAKPTGQQNDVRTVLISKLQTTKQASGLCWGIEGLMQHWSFKKHVQQRIGVAANIIYQYWRSTLFTILSTC